MTYSRTFLMMMVLVGVSTLAGCAASASKHPNIVVILADDQGWGDLSLHGNNNLSTPHIDSLAAEGVQFDQFYVGHVCAPTRAAFLTGRYYERTGVTGVSTGRERLNADEYAIGKTFKEAGYGTGAFGKWHNGTQFPLHPNAQGFDEFYGFTSGHWGNYHSPMLDHNGSLVKGDGFIVDDLTDKAMDFIEQQVKGGKPFFAYLPYCTPHSPMQVPDRFWNRFKDKKLTMLHRKPEKEAPDHTRAALAMCENIDWNVGRMLEKLESLGVAENTIVIYFSDNGPNGYRWNGSMLGKKGSIDEGGVRSPLLIRWPGQLPAGHRVTSVAGAIDLLPTLSDLAGIGHREPKPLDGISLKPLLTNTADAWPERMIFSSISEKKISVRTDRYRLSQNGKLYDMKKDPGQREDVAKLQPEVYAALSKAVKDWTDSIWPEGSKKEHRPFMVGYPGSTDTQLPARDANFLGTIKRSSIHPNCSYFTNWTQTNDRITWNVEIATEGKYQAELYYTCPKADVGSIVELSFNGQKVQGTVIQAHDPPVQGAENDRIRRSESYVKDFRPMVLGSINLLKGTGTLTLRALDISGGQVMDFRLLILKKTL